jgi:hypothetical protein
MQTSRLSPFTARIFSQRSVIGLALLFAVGAALTGCNRKPVPRDAAGKPLFDDTKVRPPANEPYFCFSVVDSEGDERSQCEVIKEWCVREIDKSKAAGRTVTSGCRAVDAVSCYVGYATGGMISNAQSFCWETPNHCEAMSARSVAALGNDNVSACKSLDKTFQPAN